MTKVSIIIRSYNEEQHIGRLLDGIKSQFFKDYEVILVDSGSTDSTVAIAKKHEVKVIDIPKNEFSFGRALNLGCKVAQGEILLFASAHVYPIRKDWIDAIIAPFSTPAVALSYGRQVGAEQTKFSEHEIFKAWFPSVSEKKQPHYFCNNANCAIRRSHWESVRYDENLTGLEDLAWAKQIWKRGGQISYVADAVIAHIHDETWSRVRNRYTREAIALRSIEPSIRFNIFDFLSFTVRSVLNDLHAATKERQLSGQTAIGIVLFRYNQFFGTWAGHRSKGELDEELRNKFYYPISQNPNQDAPSVNEIKYQKSRKPEDSQ